MRTFYIVLAFSFLAWSCQTPGQEGDAPDAADNELSAEPITSNVWWDAGEPDVEDLAYRFCGCFHEAMLATGVPEARLDSILVDMDALYGLDREFAQRSQKELERKYAGLDEQMAGLKNMDSYPCMRKLKDELDSMALNPANKRTVTLVSKTMQLKCKWLRLMQRP